MLGEEDWAAIRVDWAAWVKEESRGPAFRFLGGLLDVQARLQELEAKVTEVLDREDIGRREAAMKAAREHVNALPSEQPNARGYRDHALRPQERIQMELDVARYLLGQELWLVPTSAQAQDARRRSPVRSSRAGSTGSRYRRSCGAR